MMCLGFFQKPENFTFVVCYSVVEGKDTGELAVYFEGLY